MTSNFSKLRAKLRPEVRARAQARTEQMLTEMPLSELRLARGLSQKQLASVLHVEQASVLEMERRTDMYISTLRSHIEAMGGALRIVAKFPDGEVEINNFSEIEN